MDDRFDIDGGFSFREDNFNANMIGYTSSTGDLNTWVSGGLYHPFSGNDVLQHTWGNIYTWYDYVPGGPVTNRGINFNTGIVFRNRYHIDIDLGFDGSRTDRYEGPDGTRYDGGSDFGFSCSSDSREKLYGYLWGGIHSYCEGSRNNAGTSITFKPTPNVLLDAELDWSQTADARKYNWDLEEWDLRDTDWRSLMLSGNWMFSNYFSLRLTSQISRFSTDWQSGENSCSHRHWTNALVSWEFRPGSMFFLMVGENADPDEFTGDFGEPEFTVFTKLTWFLPV